MAIIKYEKISSLTFSQKNDIAYYDFMCNLNKNIVQYNEDYKYLGGVFFHEKINFHEKADTGTDYCQWTI